MRTAYRLSVAAACCISGCSSCEHVVFYQDISPNIANGQSQYWASAAGLTADLVGDEDALYAIALDAGIFKSVNGGPWAQLENSPQYTTALAVDPLNNSHLVAGERTGDAIPATLNRTGVWESNDAGATWTHIFNPSQQAGCRTTPGTHAVPAVTFSPTTGTLLIGTPCGVGRRPVGANQFDFTATPANVGPIRAFAISRAPSGLTILWARASGAADGRTRLLWSASDGANWNVVLVPTFQDGYGIGRPSRGGEFTLAAFGSTAVLDFRPNAASNANLWNPNTSNYCTLLYYFGQTNQFKVQALTSTGDGTGLGGRHRLQAFVSSGQSDNGVLASGQTLQIFFDAGQDIMRATGIANDGTLNWSRLALTRCAGCPSSDDIHSDAWDVHYALSSGITRLATDGGVYKHQGNSWVTQNDGLHTHHVHSLSVLPTRSYPRLAYVVTDNSEWFRDNKPLAPPFADWTTYARLGDGSWSAADARGPAVSLLVRHSRLSVFTDFGLGMPNGAGIGANSNFTPLCQPDPQNGANCRDFTFFSTATFSFIQTTRFQQPLPLLDAVMLAPWPLMSQRNGLVQNIVVGPLAGVQSLTGGPLLIRDRKFLASPDANQSQYQDWELVSNTVPLGAKGVWVANGHANPVFYVYTNLNGTVSVFRRDGGQTAWTQLSGIGAPVLDLGTVYGPLYVDPYDADHILILAADGIRIPDITPGSSIGGNTPFEVDSVLTALLTNSGEFPMSLAFGGGVDSDVVAVSQAGVFPKAVLAQVAFQPAGSSHAIAVASPMTGLFYQSDRFRAWQTLSPYLPRPFTMPSSVGQDSLAIYLGMEGRGVWRFLNQENAKLGCFYDRTSPAGPDELARLRSATTLPLGGEKLTVNLIKDGVESLQSVTTGLLGGIVVPGATGVVIQLRYSGNDDVGPCETTFAR